MEPKPNEENRPVGVWTDSGGLTILRNSPCRIRRRSDSRADDSAHDADIDEEIVVSKEKFTPETIAEVARRLDEMMVLRKANSRASSFMRFSNTSGYGSNFSQSGFRRFYNSSEVHGFEVDGITIIIYSDQRSW